MPETFSMSFLDCICCGFGAIILLLVLNEFGEPIQLEQAKVDLDAQIVKMEKEIFDIRGMALVLERELRARIEQLSEEQKRIARLRGDLSQVQGQHKASTDEEDMLKKITDRYNSQISPYYAASRLWLDAVIDPLDTRKWISMGIEAAEHAPITQSYNVGVIQT